MIQKVLSSLWTIWERWVNATRICRPRSKSVSWGLKCLLRDIIFWNKSCDQSMCFALLSNSFYLIWVSEVESVNACLYFWITNIITFFIRVSYSCMSVYSHFSLFFFRRVFFTVNSSVLFLNALGFVYPTDIVEQMLLIL